MCLKVCIWSSFCFTGIICRTLKVGLVQNAGASTGGYICPELSQCNRNSCNPQINCIKFCHCVLLFQQDHFLYLNILTRLHFKGIYTAGAIRCIPIYFHSPMFQPYYGFNSLNKKFLFFSNVQDSIATIF